MIIIPESSLSVRRSSDYDAILGLLQEVEFANIEIENADVITVRMLTESEELFFDIVSEARHQGDRVSVVMAEGESEEHYGYKLLQRTIAAFRQNNIELTMSNKTKTFLDFYENFKGDNPLMNEDYRSVFPPLTFRAGIKLRMVEPDKEIENAWRFV